MLSVGFSRCRAPFSLLLELTWKPWVLPGVRWQIHAQLFKSQKPLWPLGLCWTLWICPFNSCLLLLYCFLNYVLLLRVILTAHPLAYPWCPFTHSTFIGILCWSIAGTRCQRESPSSRTGWSGVGGNRLKDKSVTVTMKGAWAGSTECVFHPFWRGLGMPPGGRDTEAKT